MYIERDLEPRLAEALRGNKVLILYGSRQTGKTTVVEHLLSTPDMRREGVVRLSGDVLPERELLEGDVDFGEVDGGHGGDFGLRGEGN